MLTPLLRGIAADSAPTTQLEIIQRTLLSRPNLEKLISKTDLDLTLNGPSDRERLLTRLATDIKVTPQTKNLFTITYRDKSPKLAHDVVQTLLTIFVESATGGSRTDMENARRFLERQIQSYEQQLRAAEKRRADFRGRYIEVLPSNDNPNVPALESARAAAQQAEGRLQDAIDFPRCAEAGGRQHAADAGDRFSGGMPGASTASRRQEPGWSRRRTNSACCC